jgi:mono/diheme cytochrome c family protein
MRRLVVFLPLLAVLMAAVFWMLTVPNRVDSETFGPRMPDLINGRTMFYAGGCAECHATAGQEDAEKLGGGLGLKSRVGIFYVPNISSDPNDGIGGWSETAFVTAMVKGTSPDGRHYYPAFPYTSFQRMNFDDLRDLFAYIKTLPAVKGRAPGHELRFPFNIRRGVGLWKLLFLDGRPFEPDPTKSAAWNRGAYLVNGPAHCSECHSSRDAFGGIVASLRFAGGPIPTGEGWAPNITQKGHEIWTEEDFANLLKTGATQNGESVSGPMTAVVKNTAQLSPADRAAMAVYIKSLPPVDGPEPPAVK